MAEGPHTIDLSDPAYWQDPHPVLRAAREAHPVAFSGTGEAIVLGPQAAVYRGSSCGLPRVKGNGVMALTEARLVFVFLTGGRLELPLSTLTGVRDDVWFLRSYHGGRPHVIAQREDGEVGFIVTAHDDWMHALRERVGAARPTSAP